MSYRTEDIAKALHRTHGMIFLAASELGCAPVTIYRRAEKSKEIQGIIDSYRGQLIDKAELKLEQAVMSGEPWAVQFCLKTIGKKRGYVERLDVTSKGESIVDQHQSDRAISTLADAIGEIIHRETPEQQSDVDATEQATVDGASIEGG